jgi:DNA (cytosine-5)-methyltransferase 1
MLRCIQEVQPRWVVGENVLGLVNWSDGLVFHEVQADLEAEGYEVQPYVLPAVSVNAPHRRDRVWFVAYSNNARANIAMRNQREWSQSDNEWQGQPFSEHRQNGINRDVANPNSTNSQTRTQREILGESDWEKTNGHSNVERRNQWQNFPTVSPICNGDDGIPDRLDSITFPKWRNESIKAGGNAIVPQVVLQIFKTIEQYERINTSDKNS